MGTSLSTACALVSAILSPQGSSSPPGKRAREHLSARVEQVVSTHRYLSSIHEGAPGGVLLVAMAGEVVFRRSFGAAELDSRTPCDSETRFTAVAMSHAAPALLAQSMIADGTLAGEDRVAHLLPVLADSCGETTIDDLIENRATFVSLETLFYFRRRDELGQVDRVSGLSALGRMRRLERKPHGPTNLMILSAAAEAAGGRSLTDLTRTRVLDPAEISDAGWDDSGHNRARRRAVNYTMSRVHSEWTEVSRQRITCEDGALWLTADEHLQLARLALPHGTPGRHLTGLVAEVSRTSRPALRARSPVVYFKEQDVHVVWASNDRRPSSQALAQQLGTLLFHPPRSGGALGIGGGSGRSYRGSFGRCPLDGRWPVGEYRIEEVDQPLALFQDERGRLHAFTPGIGAEAVVLERHRFRNGSLHGSLRGSQRMVETDFPDPSTDGPLLTPQWDSLHLEFREGDTGLPELASISLERNGWAECALTELRVTRL